MSNVVCIHSNFRVLMSIFMYASWSRERKFFYTLKKYTSKMKKWQEFGKEWRQANDRTFPVFFEFFFFFDSCRLELKFWVTQISQSLKLKKVTKLVNLFYSNNIMWFISWKSVHNKALKWEKITNTIQDKIKTKSQEFLVF